MSDVMRKLKPTGWDLMGGDRGKWHFFDAGGRSLCGKWANLTWNELAHDVHPDNQCAACRRKFRARTDNQIRGSIMRPFDAKKTDDVVSLRRDNFDANGAWILTDGYEVSLATQKMGKPPSQHIAFTRATFNKLVAWYMKDQKPSKRKVQRR